MNITDPSDPAVLIKNVTVTAVESYCPPLWFLVAYSVSAGGLLTMCILYTNPVTIGSTIHVVTEIYEIC